MIRANTKPRPGFTLVELLVVLAIIAILIGIIVPAVQRVRAVGTKTSAVSEINQLSLAAAAFKNEFGFYPPDTYVVPTAAGDPTLKRMFPRWSGVPSFGGAGWSGTLNGNQCLVFFLGGPGGTGWDGANPNNVTPGPNKKGPFYEFPTNRLIGAPASYVDPWKTPYAYFRSVDGNYQDAATSYGTPGSLWPYRSGGRYVNTTGVQVVSAGPNAQFGPGSPKTAAGPPPVYQDWVPGTGQYSQAAAGGDDLGNFNEGLVLGAQN